MPYVVTVLAGRSAGGRPPPSTIVRNAVGSMRPSAVETSDTSVAPLLMTASASKPGWTVSGVPACRLRVTTDSPPTCDSGRQASQWSSSRTSSRALVAAADAATASWVSTTPFGRAGRPARGDDERVARPRPPRRHASSRSAQPWLSPEAADRRGTRRHPHPRSSGARRRTRDRRAGRWRRAAASCTPRRRSAQLEERRHRPHHGPRMNRWIIGARPRTLPAAVVPVAIGAACAVGPGRRGRLVAGRRWR